MVILVRLPVFELPIDVDAGAVAYHARLINQGEPLYSTHHPTHHLPAIYYTFAMIFKLFGDHSSNLQLFLAFWMWINGLIIIRIVETFSNTKFGFISAVIFILISSMANLNGDTAEMELFANVPISLLILLSIALFSKQKKPYLFFTIGALGAISFLFKAVYITSLLAVSLTLFLELMLKPTKKYLFRFLKNISIILSGYIIIIGLVVWYFSVQGLFSRVLLVFQAGSQYVKFSTSPWYFILLIPIILIVRANFSLLIFGILSSFRLLIHFPTSIKRNRTRALMHFSIVCWLFISIIAAGFSRFGFGHYGILLVPPLSVLFGIEISELWSIIKKQNKNKLRIKSFIFPFFLIFIVIGNTFFSSYDYLRGYINYRLGNIRLAEFAANYTSMGSISVSAQEIATYINQNTKPEDFIFSWTELAQIFYLANRRSSVDVIWPLYVSSFGPPERAFDLKPVYIIIGPTFFNSAEIPYWLSNELGNSYHLEKSFNQHDVYRFNNSEG